MTAIRPPGPLLPPNGSEALQGPTTPSTSSVAPQAVAAPSSAAPPTAAPSVDPTRAVLADLQAARISPHEAVRALTSLALEKARCPASMRPAVEARVRATLSNDPLVGALLRRMGAASPADDGE